MYFQTAMSDLELLKCYRLRYKVYCEEKRWISAKDFPNRLEKDLYDEKAIHIMAYDSEFELVGLMRILCKRDYNILPYQKHPGLKERDFLAPNVAELSRFMVTAKKKPHGSYTWIGSCCIPEKHRNWY